MKPIDFHAHIYPDSIAQKASKSIGVFYEIPIRHDGRVSTLLKLGQKYNIGRFVVHSVATTPAQVESINNFIASVAQQYPDRFIGFATMHPDFENIGAEIDRAVSLGLKGIKIHPDFQQFYVDSKNACRIYEAAEGRLPILIHMGDFRYQYSKPARIASVLDRFPKLDVVGAHFGGWSEWDSAAQELQGKRMYVDTSSSLYAMPPRRARELIDLFGVDHVLFGTDYPMWDPGEELERIDKIGLKADELEKIMYLNAKRLLKL